MIRWITAFLLGTALCTLGEHGPMVTQLIAKCHQTPTVVEGKIAKIDAYGLVKRVRQEVERLQSAATAYHAMPQPGADELNNLRISFGELYTLPDNAVVELYAADVRWAPADSCAGIEQVNKHGKSMGRTIASRDLRYLSPSPLAQKLEDAACSLQEISSLRDLLTSAGKISRIGKS